MMPCPNCGELAISGISTCFECGFPINTAITNNKSGPTHFKTPSDYKSKKIPRPIPFYRKSVVSVLITVTLVATGSVGGVLGYWYLLDVLDEKTEIDDSVPRGLILVYKYRNGNYHLVVSSIYPKFPISNFTWELWNKGGVKVQHGELALQNTTGRWKGIDVSWDDDGPRDIVPGNGLADRSEKAGGPYSDPRQAQIRIEDVKTGKQEKKPYQRGEGTISVTYFDKDKNGKLSQRDTFNIKGNNTNNIHYANTGWTFKLYFHPGEIYLGEFYLHGMMSSA